MATKLRPTPGYVRGVGLSPVPAFRPNIDDSVGAALKGLGGAIASVAADAQARREQDEDFQAKNDYNAFEQTMQEKLRLRTEEYAGTNGDGLHRSYEADIASETQALLSKLPDRLKSQYQTLLSTDPDQPGAAYTKLTLTGAAAERETRQGWYKDMLVKESDATQKAVAADPEGWDGYAQRWVASVDSSGLSTAQKNEMREKGLSIMAKSWADAMLERSPENFLRTGDIDPRLLSPQARRHVITEAQIAVESSNDAGAVSPKGAVGLLQVMPETAAEIAKEIKDGNFPGNGDPERVRQYLSDPTISRRYGNYYMNKMLAKYNGDVEAALIAYNGGAARANAWIAKGRDDSVLPKETADYYKKVMAKARGGLLQKPDAPSQYQMPLKAANEFLKSRNPSGRNWHIDDMKPEMQQRLAALIQALPPGIKEKMNVMSGARTVPEQTRLWNKSNKSGRMVGSPTGSRHVHGDAADLRYGELRLDKAPKEVVEAVHRLAPQYGLKFPMSWEKWHIELQETRGGKPFNGSLASAKDGPMSHLSYAEWQSYKDRAENAVLKRPSDTFTPVQKIELRREMDNEISMVRTTGQGTPGFDENRIATILGADDLSKYEYARRKAEALYKNVSPVATMSDAAMDDHVAMIEPVPGSSDFAQAVEVKAAVEKEVDRVRRLRSRDPGEAAMLFDDVKEAGAKAQAALSKGDDPAAVQTYVRLMLERQKDFNVEPKARAPIPQVWAQSIGKSLLDIPPIGTKLPDGTKVTPQAVREALATAYQKLEGTFGEFTDEVILYALSTYKGLDPDTADYVTSVMQVLAKGGDPAKLLGKKQVAENPTKDEEGGFLSFMNRVYPGGDKADTETIPAEQLRRATEAYKNAASDEERAAVEARYPPHVMDVVKRSN